MKKLIALISVGFSIAFAVALAHAEENPATTTQQPGSDVSKMGQAGSDTGKAGETTSESTSNTSPQAMSEDQLKATKSCTDENGVTYRRGKKGFSRCIETKKRQMKEQQMGGQIGGDTSSNSSPSYSNR